VVRVECSYCIRLDKLVGYKIEVDATHPFYQWIIAAALRGIEEAVEVELVVSDHGGAPGVSTECVVLRQSPEQRPRYDFIGWGRTCNDARKRHELDKFYLEKTGRRNVKSAPTGDASVSTP